MRYYLGKEPRPPYEPGTDPRWRNRWVEVLVRGKGPGPKNALVEFDTGERVVVLTYAGGPTGALLRRKAP
jgi:hypothetical protein